MVQKEIAERYWDGGLVLVCLRLVQALQKVRHPPKPENLCKIRGCPSYIKEVISEASFLRAACDDWDTVKPDYPEHFNTMQHLLVSRFEHRMWECVNESLNESSELDTSIEN